MATNAFSITVANGKPLTIYGETANINYFLKTNLVPNQDSGVTNHTSSVGTFTRQQYPGDTTTQSVAGHTRSYMKDGSRRSGSALPGKNFVLKEVAADGTGEVRTFSFKGRVMDLAVFLRLQAAMDLVLALNTGARYEISEAATTP
jgi:hypothetical protein